jgi:endonuclease YncB( thermonuclease family)
VLHGHRTRTRHATALLLKDASRPLLVPSARVACWRSCASVFGLRWVLVPFLASAEPCTGQVVGIANGDTVNVLREGQAVQGRLHGVETPEKAQAFGTQAPQLTGELAF